MEYKYVIMCGTSGNEFEVPRQLTEINNERLVDRTIRLLKENGIKNIYISSNNPLFDNCGVERLEHENNKYWLDAYYPFEDNDKVCYIYGDVYYSEEAIKTIVSTNKNENILFGTSDAKNKYHQNWGEPFAYKVYDNKTFKEGIKAVKKMQDEGKLQRVAITWELYRYLNKLDVNIQNVLDKTYICIDDETMDIDTPEEIEELRKRVEK